MAYVFRCFLMVFFFHDSLTNNQITKQSTAWFSNEYFSVKLSITISPHSSSLILASSHSSYSVMPVHKKIEEDGTAKRLSFGRGLTT